MKIGTFGLLELGSCSLKFYLVQPFGEDKKGSYNYRVKPIKFPWRVAHHFFRVGDLCDEIFKEVLHHIEAVKDFSAGLPLHEMLALGGGVFREIPICRS